MENRLPDTSIDGSQCYAHVFISNMELEWAVALPRDGAYFMHSNKIDTAIYSVDMSANQPPNQACDLAARAGLKFWPRGNIAPQ